MFSHERVIGLCPIMSVSLCSCNGLFLTSDGKRAMLPRKDCKVYNALPSP